MLKILTKKFISITYTLPKTSAFYLLDTYFKKYLRADPVISIPPKRDRIFI